MSKHPDSAPESSSRKARKGIPIWQAMVLPVAAILIFFFLLEGGLALFGVKPALKTEDPFVGFASNVPLFIPAPVPGGGQQLITAPNKRNFFNQQSFQRVKAKDTYRIFCLGGSTTYGRPYNDTTSFAGWLRELLPVADSSKNWEVINAGGISYASYRVAHLMEELVNYQPDLFIIYTGHNEFLEERTYSQIRKIPPVVRSTISLLARTRTWSAMTTVLQSVGIYPQIENKDRDRLAGEVDIILDRSAGLDRYTRDDPLRENILHHYRISLERMVALARSVGAQVIFVTPASNLKDCSPFKSEDTQGLAQETGQHTEQMLGQAKDAMRQENWDEALNLLGAAVALNPRHAELQYRLGKTLLALGRLEEAEVALRLARDEDVCPLRALTPMRRIVAEIAEVQDVELVDYIDLLNQRMQALKGYSIPGEEFFLDHVHPTIEGHKILAVALVEAMANQGVVRFGPNWSEGGIAAVSKKIESRIDQETHGQALANLARVLFWAGKSEDAARLSRQAMDTAGQYQQVAVDATSILVSVYQKQGNAEQAVQLMYSTLEKAPGAIELRLKLGQALLNPPFLQLEEAAANLLLVCQQMPYFHVPFQLFGSAMARRSRPRIAYIMLMEALRLNPNNMNARKILAQVQPLLQGNIPVPQSPNIALEVYPSLAPRKLVQLHRDQNGRMLPDGIEVEFHENGRIKRFLDIEWGQKNGLEVTWDPNGRQLSRLVYLQKIPVDVRPAE